MSPSSRSRFCRAAFTGCAWLAISLARPASAADNGSPSPSPASVAAASALLQANDAAGAMRLLEIVTKREPKNGRAWRVLANACKQEKQWDQAIAAAKQALAVDPKWPTPFYTLGTIYALKGEKDAAFDWLGKARATHWVDMTGVAQDADLATIKDDPRFAALIPKPEEFARPFVEQVKIIREFDGESLNDQFGWIARPLGDVDGDGVTDFVTSAPTSSAGGETAGRVYVYSTKSGQLLWKADGQAKDQLGTGVECAGDTNGDGIPDVVASGPGNGVAYIYSGKDGRVLVSLKSANKEAENFGAHVAGVGDVDHDGHADVIIGAPAGPKGLGHAYIYSGKDGRLLKTLTAENAGDDFGSAVAGYSDGKHMFLLVGAPQAGPRQKGRVYVYDQLADTPKFVIEGDETGKGLGGMFLSVLGDVDGDGVPDVYASDWPNEAKGQSTGRVYVHSGADGHRLLTLTGETAGEGFGTCPARAGDVDGDGRADLIVGAWQYAGAAMSGGRCSLYSGKDGKLLKTYTCRIPGDTLGFDAVGIGDVDGDGTVDLLLSSAWSGIRGFHSGRVFIVSSEITR